MPVTLVCMADTHTFQDDWKTIPHGDILVHAGDMGRAGDEEELTAVAAWLRSLPHRHKVVVPGNHDFLFEHEPEKARAIFHGMTVLIDESAVVGGLRFWGSPWTPEFHSWAFMLPRGAPLAEKWAVIPEAVDVLVTHGPPHGILDDSGRYRGRPPTEDLLDELGDPEAIPAGCEALRERIRVVRPRLHLFGHIHNNQGRVEREGTLFVNCTTNEAELPPVVVELA